MLTISYLMQLTHSVTDGLPGNLHIRKVHDHPKATTKPYWKQEWDFLLHDVYRERATGTL